MRYAEAEYLFSHTILRDAAYASQSGPERAGLHALALEVMEQMFPRAERGTIARAIARHAAEAFRGGTLPPAVPGKDILALTELRALRAAAEKAEANYDVRESSELWQRVADHELIEPRERFDALLRAAEALRHAGRMQEARARVNEARTLAPSDTDYMRCLLAHASQLRLMGELKEAEDRARLALRSAETPGQRADATGILAHVWRDAGRGDEAEMLFRQSMELHRQAGDELSEAKIAGGFAAFLSERGRNDEAEKLYRRAFQIHQAAGDPRGEAIYCGNLGILMTEAGRYAEAEQFYQAALATHRLLGNRTDEAIVSGNYAILLKARGRGQDAELHYRRAINVLREQGNRPMEARYLGNLANLLDDTGRTVQAVGMYEMALDILRGLGQPRLLGMCLGNLGLARQKLGRTDEAYTALSEGIALLVEQQARLPAGAFLALRGELQLLLGEEGGAEGDLLEAEALLKGEHARGFRLQFLLPLRVRLHAHRGELEQAEFALKQARETATGLDPQSEQARALDTCEGLIQAAQQGELINGHRASDLPKELRRAAARRLHKSAPETATALEA